MNHELDIYLYIIVALLPLTSCLVVFQVNPYHALALRGILGAIAALVYAVLGAADVALTEALMGTLLAITLYAVAVRSSLVLRVGMLADAAHHLQEEPAFIELTTDFRRVLNKRHMRLELVPYNDIHALQRALSEKEIHATCTHHLNTDIPLRTTIRIWRVYEIMQTELISPQTVLNYATEIDVNLPKLEEQPL
jgi:putative multicomponent Na+:H+ antiporter subunit B